MGMYAKQRETHYYLDDGNSLCAKNFGIFPTLRMSLYGMFLINMIFHIPMKPILSIFWPSDSKVCNVTSSKNIAKQTVFFERLVICKDVIRKTIRRDVSGFCEL